MRVRNKGNTRRRIGVAAAALVGIGLLQPALVAPSVAAPEGQGFTLNRSDLRFILKQIKIAEEHARTLTADNPCGTLVGPGVDQIPGTANGRDLPWGLRTVDGSCNNLIAGRERWGAADRIFPRSVKPAHFRSADDGTSYAQKTGVVRDRQPRRISNTIVDQTATNPAAVEVAGPDAPTDPESGTLFIPNVAPDTGLSAPFNAVFTLFGQFFDHGLDLVSKSGGTVYMPLASDDPLVAGPNGVFGDGDDLPPQLRFMVLTRATNQPGPDGQMGTADDVQEASNITTSYVDQNQTYTSHPSHQVFLREFEAGATGPVETGRLITSPGAVAGDHEGMADWGRLKAQSADLLGIQLTDVDSLNVPMLATDPYGNFTRGLNGYPQIVTATGLVEGDPAANGGEGVLVPQNATRTGHPFLADIAHHAVPLGDRNPSDGPGPIVPLDRDSDAGVTDDHDPNTYDDEMLASHFMAGDGRVNENIGLMSIHHVFHSEHNRLVEDIKNVITTLDPTMLPEWQSAGGAWDGDRLFQAARFVTEMEYQHLVFEEFGRKVQPMVNLFGEGGTGYQPGVDPTIRAEFAHAVYRFGHSMLNETVARRNADNTVNNIGLVDAFLNPQAYFDGGPAGQLDAFEAAGSVFRGSSRQVGNEIDEFVTDALRNNLLGLPLDLATINMARARDTGVPSLNASRRAFYQASNNSALRPYESWADFHFSLRNPASLVNFIAAYGTHPSITGSIQARRDAAALLVAADPNDPATPPDAYDFLNSVGAWANGANGATTTGVDDIDLWMGGLAEKPMVFGGMLGATFNYVFETQMEDLQDADRFYYLSRTAGLNLLTQLEGNSFAELVMRNTDVSGLPADAFSRPDFVYDVSALGTTGAIPDDPATEDWNESTQLVRMPDGTIRFGGGEHVVFNGNDSDATGQGGHDRIWSSEGDDTIRGNGGDDWMQGGDGNDNQIGGLGDDIMSDLNGDDTLKGGNGDDAMSSGQGLGGDLNQGGLGKDFVVGGNDITETFAGPGDDFVYAGEAEDTVFGDDGDDWIEGGRGPFGLLQGDNGAPFQDDPNEPGHDVLNGDGGEQDYDAEGGDDIMLAGPGIQRSEGMLGFDWVTHQGDPLPGNSDMAFTLALPPSVETNVDRFDMVEALSGYGFDDTLRGDDRTTADLDVIHELTAEGIARINGLGAILPTGTTSYDAGNILIGGGGSDTIEGRGGDDVIDGDAQLSAQLQAPDPSTTDTTDVQLVDSMSALQTDVFAGRIDPGDITIVRSITTPDPGTSVDTAVFTGPRSDYTISVTNGFLTVTDNQGTDGVDRLRNVEVLTFADQSVTVRAPGAPTGVTATAGNGSAVVSWTAPAANGGPAVTDYVIEVTDGTTVTTVPSPGTATTRTVTGLTNGTTYSIQVRAINSFGQGEASTPPVTVTPVNNGPTVTAQSPAAGATNVIANTNVTATFGVNVAGVNGTTFQLRRVSNNAVVNATVTYNATTRTATLNPGANLLPGVEYRATLTGGANAIRAAAGGAPLTTQSWTFTVDGTAPTVFTGPGSLTTPALNATGVSRTANIVIEFSERMLGINATNVRLRNLATNALVGRTVTVATSNGRSRAILNPNVTLAANTNYRVELLGGAGQLRDLSNNLLGNTNRAFRTGG